MLLLVTLFRLMAMLLLLLVRVSVLVEVVVLLFVCSLQNSKGVVIFTPGGLPCLRSIEHVESFAFSPTATPLFRKAVAMFVRRDRFKVSGGGARSAP